MSAPYPTSQPDAEQPVLIVGAGPVGCTAALLLADYGIPVTLLERRADPHPLPRAVHLDDEVARILGRTGVSDSFLARSRPASGLRLLDAAHRVIGEIRRDCNAGSNGFPQANMFDQPDLEQLLLTRVAQHPLITMHRQAHVSGLDGASGAPTEAPVRLHTRLGAGSLHTFTGCVVLGCDGANSTIRQLVGIGMDDLGFTESWLVIDVDAEAGLDTWDGVEQICDPARAATFMHVSGRRYRWEFQLRDGEDEAALTTPQALGRLLQPWTGRSDLAGLNVVRSATYTFRARVASRFQTGRVFLLGDAAHLTPPFIGQGLGAGLRDAENLAWKIAHVLTGQAGEDLLNTYDTERRPHARAMVKKAVRIGWAMTGGQDRAAAARRIALAAALRSAHIRDAIASTATPRLKKGALHRAPRLLWTRADTRVRTGGLIPNPLVTTGNETPVRLDTVLNGRTAVLTAGQPTTELAHLCRQQRLLLLRVSGPATAGTSPRPGAAGDVDWTDVHLTENAEHPVLRALTHNPALTVLIRPDRVIAAVDTHARPPRLPWTTPAGPTAPQPAHPHSHSSSLVEAHHVRRSLAAARRGLPPARLGQTPRPPEDA
jgi:3-(3-hydroxy-phenyl)propionate hydroxylase